MTLIPHLHRFTRILLLALLVSVALASSVIRFWLIPQATELRAQLQASIGDRLGQPVRIGALAARMRGIYPELILKDFAVIAADDQAPLRFGQIRLVIDPLRSLLYRSPVLDRIELAEATVTLQRGEDGRFGILGLQGEGGSPAWLLSAGAIALVDIEVVWRDGQRPPRRLGMTNLFVRRDGDRHRASLGVELAPQFGKSLTVIADVSGDLFRSDGWSGRVFVDADGLLAGISELAEMPLSLSSGTASAKFWGEWADGRLQRVTSWLALDRPVLTHVNRSDRRAQFGIDRASGWFRWRRETQGFRVDGDGVELSLYGQPWPLSRFAVAVAEASDGGFAAVRAAASFLRLDDLRALVDGLDLLPSESRALLHALAPRGDLRDLKLVHEPGAGSAVCAEFAGLGLKSHQHWPGVGGLNGGMCGDATTGRFRVDSSHGSLDIPTVFAKTIALESASVQGGWRRTPAGLMVSASNLALKLPGLSADARIDVQLSDGEGDGAVVDLRASFAAADIVRLKSYLPYGVVPDTSAWLARALTGGSVGGRLLLRGPLGDFPFNNGEGVFQVVVDGDGLGLDFHPDWPPLRDVRAHFLFNGGSMAISADAGFIGDAPMRAVTGFVPDLVEAPWLTLDGEVVSALPQVMAFLKASPLNAIPDRLLKFAEPQGPVDIGLHLRIPLDSSLGDTTVDGIAHLQSASLILTAINQTLRDIGGDLHFSQDGLDARAIKARFLGEPVAIDVARSADYIQVGMSGQASVVELRQALGGKALPHLQGGAGYRLELSIPDALDEAPVPLRGLLTSDLIGLSVDLPEPLGKSEQARRPLRVEFARQNGVKTPLWMSYGDDARMQLLLSDPATGFRFEQGAVAVGAPLPPLPSAGGIRMALALRELDVGLWRDVIGGAEATNGGWPVGRMDVDIGQLRWHGDPLGRLVATATRGVAGWAGDVDCAYGNGQFQLKMPVAAPAVLKLDLEQLRLPKSALGDRPSGSAGDYDPSALPNVQIASRRVLWKGMDLGALTLETEAGPRGTTIKAFRLEKPNHRLQLTGSWLRSAGGEQTALDGRLTAKDLGQLLTDLGYGKEIRGTATDIRFAVQWPAAPHRFSAGIVDGDFRLKLGRGSILKMEPGLGRVLGMLNLGTLRRLLLLDFSDLFGRGLVYDSMKGRFRLSGGQARTEGFLIDAAAANIVITGRVGLVAKDLDELIVVIPHTLASLPMAGAAVGGAAVGAAIDVATDLMGHERISIAGTNYAVKGSWDNPKIERLGGNLPLDVLDHAWSSLKDLSGFGSEDEDNHNE